MEALLSGTEKSPALVSDYREYHTNTTVKFVITVPEVKVERVEQEGPYKVFKLHTTFTTSSMVLFDCNGCLKRYDTPAEILREFFRSSTSVFTRRERLTWWECWKRKRASSPIRNGLEMNSGNSGDLCVHFPDVN